MPGIRPSTPTHFQERPMISLLESLASAGFVGAVFLIPLLLGGR